MGAAEFFRQRPNFFGDLAEINFQKLATLGFDFSQFSRLVLFLGEYGVTHSKGSYNLYGN
jgi:hypothetical protein